LSFAGEKLARSGELVAYLKSTFPQTVDFFIPYATFTHLDKSSLINVMEGYFFIEYSLEDYKYLSLVGTRYINNVLHDGQGRGATLLTVPDEKVSDLRSRLSSMIASELEVGMNVRVNRGPLQGICGVLLSFDGNYAQILIELRTLKAIRTVLRFELTPEDCDG